MPEKRMESVLGKDSAGGRTSGGSLYPLRTKAFISWICRPHRVSVSLGSTIILPLEN